MTPEPLTARFWGNAHFSGNSFRLWELQQKWSPAAVLCRLASSIVKMVNWKENLKKKKKAGAPIVAQLVRNPTRLHEDAGSILRHTQRVKDPPLL